ncbi:MAG: phage shock envelope stress response protein PspM [Pseudonocardiaceae bacterium]
MGRARRPPQKGHYRGPAAAGGLPVPARLSDLNVPVAEVRQTWVRWNDPAARLKRRKRRTSRMLTLWIVLTILCGIAVAAGVIGASAASGVAASVFTAIAGMVVFGAFGVRAGLRLRQLNRTPVAAKASRVALPSQASAAYEPMRRLAQAEASLAELLAQLSTPADGISATVPEVSVADARSTSSQAAAVLRGLGRRVEAVERAREAAPAGERAALQAAVRTLCDQLEDGLDDYGRLVAAAGRAVAAAGSGVDSSRQALTDANDRLAGLAIALRELS